MLRTNEKKPEATNITGTSCETSQLPGLVPLDYASDSNNKMPAMVPPDYDPEFKKDHHAAKETIFLQNAAPDQEPSLVPTRMKRRMFDVGSTWNFKIKRSRQAISIHHVMMAGGQVADIFTKLLGAHEYHQLRTLLLERKQL